jgi:hypothetical protein
MGPGEPGHEGQEYPLCARRSKRPIPRAADVCQLTTRIRSICTELLRPKRTTSSETSLPVRTSIYRIGARSAQWRGRDAGHSHPARPFSGTRIRPLPLGLAAVDLLSLWRRSLWERSAAQNGTPLPACGAKIATFAARVAVHAAVIATSAEQWSSLEPVDSHGSANVAIKLPQVRGRRDLDRPTPHRRHFGHPGKRRRRA